MSIENNFKINQILKNIHYFKINSLRRYVSNEKYWWQQTFYAHKKIWKCYFGQVVENNLKKWFGSISNTWLDKITSTVIYPWLLNKPMPSMISNDMIPNWFNEHWQIILPLNCNSSNQHCRNSVSEQTSQAATVLFISPEVASIVT